MEIDLEKYKTCRMCEECDPEYAFCCKPLIAYIERLEAVVEAADKAQQAWVRYDDGDERFRRAMMELIQALQAVKEGK